MLAAYDLGSLEPWQRQQLELAAMLAGDLDGLDPADHRERRLTIESIAKLVKAAFPAPTSAASDAGRALVSVRYSKPDYATALKALDEG